MTCGTNQSNFKRWFDPTLKTGGMVGRTPSYHPAEEVLFGAAPPDCESSVPFQVTTLEAGNPGANR